MRDYTETDAATIEGESCAALESDGLGKALRNADYAPLTTRAATDNSRAPVDEVLHLIATVEARKRERGGHSGRRSHRFTGGACESTATGIAAEGWLGAPEAMNKFPRYEID